MGRRRRVVLQAMGIGLATVALALTACEPVTPPPPYVPPPTAPGTQRIAVFGDSIPGWLIRDGSSAVDHGTTTLVNGTLDACEGAKDNPPARTRTGAVAPTPLPCAKGWPSMYPPYLTIHADVAILQSGTHAMLDHKLDGTWRHPCHGPARTWYQADVNARLKYLATKATRVVLVLPAWPGPNSGWVMPADASKRADCVRAVLKAAARGTGAIVLDFGAYLCPTGPTTCTLWRAADGVHVDPVHAATVLSWLLGSSMLPPAAASAPPGTHQFG